MKILLTLLIIFMPIIAYSQKENKFPLNNDGSIELREVVDCELSKNELYSNALKWASKTFMDYKDLVQLQDSVNGKFVINGTYRARGTGRMKLISSRAYFTVSIECKEGRYRYTIYNFYTNAISSFDGEEIQTGEEYGSYTNYINSYNEIEQCDKDLSLISAMDKSNLSRKEKKKVDSDEYRVNRNKEKLLNHIDGHYKMHTIEYDNMIYFIENLKKEMLVIDDF